MYRTCIAAVGQNWHSQRSLSLCYAFEYLWHLHCLYSAAHSCMSVIDITFLHAVRPPWKCQHICDALYTLHPEQRTVQSRAAFREFADQKLKQPLKRA